MAEMDYNIHDYVLVSVLSIENKNLSDFITLERAFYVYRGRESSSSEQPRMDKFKHSL